MLSNLLGSDPHAGFIAASYGLSFVVLTILTLYLVRDLKSQWKSLRELEKETGKQRWS